MNTGHIAPFLALDMILQWENIRGLFVSHAPMRSNTLQSIVSCHIYYGLERVGACWGTRHEQTLDRAYTLIRNHLVALFYSYSYLEQAIVKEARIARVAVLVIRSSEIHRMKSLKPIPIRHSCWFLLVVKMPVTVERSVIVQKPITYENQKVR